jgi:hypothetical protein
MRIFFGGGEVPAHRNVLARQGVRNLAFNVQPIADMRSGNAGDPAEMEPFFVAFYASQTVNGDASAVIKKYSDHTSLVIGDEFRVDMPTIPVWNGDSLEDFYELAVEHNKVFVNEADASLDSNARALTMFFNRNPSVEIWTVTSKANVLRLPFITHAIVTGWISAQKHRELQVWDGTKVARSPRASRAKQIDEHAAQITNLGFDPEKLKDADVDENVKLAIQSWLQYELVTRTPLSDTPVHVGEGGVPLAIRSERPRQREPVLLPSLTMIKTGEETTNIAPASTTLKQCNSCVVSHLCPEFEPGAQCAYSIPVEIRSKDQLAQIVSSLLEMQAQRAFEARFIEELKGEGPTGEASRELDRWFQMGERAKAISEETVSIKQTISGPGGMLSQFFGKSVGEQARALPSPIDADTIIEELMPDDG